MVSVDKLTDFLIIDAKTTIAHMLCRSAIVGPNNPATSAILVFTMSRSPPQTRSVTNLKAGLSNAGLTECHGNHTFQNVVSNEMFKCLD